MTQSEFKAWFEGYAEGMEGLPNAKQWKRIKENVALITGVETTRTVYLDRYYWQRPLYPAYCGGYGAVGSNGAAMQAQLASNAQDVGSLSARSDAHWDSGSAFAALGRSEAASDA